MFKRIEFVLLFSLVMLTLSGCNLFNALGLQTTSNETPTLEPTSTPLPSPTIQLAPTLPPGTAKPATPFIPTETSASEQVEGDATPTALPAPTEIIPVTGTPEGGETLSGAQLQVPSGPGISIDPQLGEPLDVVIVKGDGFPPNVIVSLHWSAVDGPTGEVYWQVETDANGSFTVGLKVPPAEKWPGGPPRELDYIQLRATTKELGAFYYWANFRYVKRFDPITSLVLTYTNPDYGYAIDLPNLWTWNDDDTFNVRFAAPSGVGKGFVRAVDVTTVGAAIQAVMPVEAPGQSYTTAEKTLGAYPGMEATTNKGLIVWFIPAKGRVYALSFTDDSGQFYIIIASSFRLK